MQEKGVTVWCKGEKSQICGTSKQL